ncbi:MAG: radical SAM protein [Planctomycetes bacterium]|nr:radical SAM protein [Planctomycetota bacterium]
MSSRWLKKIALVCMTPEVDAQEHARDELPSYGIHRIQAAIIANPFFANTEVRIIDLGVDNPEAYFEELVRFDPQLIGYSLFVWSTSCLVEVAKRFRVHSNGSVQVFGGPSARSALLDLAPFAPAHLYADALVIRDGEEAFNQMAMQLDELQDRVKVKKAFELIEGVEIPSPLGWYRSMARVGKGSMDHLPSPYQMGLMRYGAFGYLETFRGCPMSCRFCEWGMMDVSQGCFSEDYLTRELEALAEVSPQAVFDVDSGLNLNAQAFRNLSNAESKVGILKKTGLWCEIYPSKIKPEHLDFLSACGPTYLGVGLQSIQPTVLKSLNRPFGKENFEGAIKQLREVVESVEIQIIFGLPTDSPAGFLETLAFARSQGVGVRVYHCLVLPDALLTRGKPEWQMEFCPQTLSMHSCVGWTETDILQMREYLSQETKKCGGRAGRFWWSFPNPGQRNNSLAAGYAV